MTTAVLKKKTALFGPDANGTLMTPEEFDRADFVDGFRYELINGVLIVSPIPSEKEADPNEELGYLLRKFQEEHPNGSALNLTLPERNVRTRVGRRRVDRVIWAGLGRLPRKNENPTILAEFVSAGKRNRERDYLTKRDEYMELGALEYWIIDRFDRRMAVHYVQGGKIKKRVIRENQTCKTPLLPGFILPLARLLALADRWEEEE